MRIALKGGAAFRQALSDKSNGLRDAMEDAVAEAVLSIDAGVKLKIQRGPASGRVYKKSSPKRVHRASAPGEAPATDTGNLIGSIYTNLNGLTGTVGSRLAYAAYLEYGTRHIAARPAWEPVVERVAKEFQANAEAAIARVIK